jgi:hypothetical protein
MDDGSARDSGMAARWSWLAPALLAVLSVTMVAVSPLRGVELGDEGLIAMGGWRILQGQVPAKDFFAIIPPLPFLTAAGVYSLFGITVWAGRLLALAYAVALAGLMFALSRRLAPRALHGAAALSTLVSCGVAAWLLPSHHWLADVMALAALLAFDVALDSRPKLWAFAGGAAAAACAVSLQDQGAALILALALWIALRAPRARRGTLARASVVGMAAVIAPLAFWLLPRVAFSTLAYEWIVFPLTRYGKLPANAPGFLGAWREVASLWSAGLFREAPVGFTLWNLKLAFVCLAPLGAAAVLWSLRGRSAQSDARVSLIAAGLFAFYLPVLRRPALVNLEWALPAAALALAHGLDRMEEERREWRRLLSIMTACAMVVVFAGAGLVRIPGLLRGAGPSVRTPAGVVGPLAPERARQLQQIVEEISESAAPGETVFTAGFASMINLLVQRPNPTPFDVFVPPDYTTPRQVEIAIAALEKSRTRWIVRPEGFSGGERWDRYLSDHFELDAPGRYELWRRRRFAESPRRALNRQVGEKGDGFSDGK